jgi:sugar phosphate isomerase/epimerase
VTRGLRSARVHAKIRRLIGYAAEAYEKKEKDGPGRRHASMIWDDTLSRRSFLSLAATTASAAPLVATAGGHIPVGLELYSVRDELARDPHGTVRAVAAMGYEIVEFYAPYFEWSSLDAKKMRSVMDDVGVRCLSTHNNAKSFTANGLPHAIELNQILGSKFIVFADAVKADSVDAFKRVAENLNRTTEKIKPLGLRTGYHNEESDFLLMGDKRPIEVLAANTSKSVMLQLDVGTCLEAGYDAVAWIMKNPGRIRSMHCKDWSPEPSKGYSVLFGEGVAPWKRIFAAAEKVGGIEYYLIEQEGSAYPAMETAKRCLATYWRLKAEH